MGDVGELDRGVVDRRVRRRRRGSPTGPRSRARRRAELALLAGYYVARTIQGVASGTEVLLFWVGGAVVGGVVFGLAGAWWRSPIVWRQVVGLALLAGALVGEGAVRWAMFPWQGASGAVMCAVGVVVAVALARGQRQRWVTPLALVVVVPLALAGNHLSNAVIVG